MAWTSGKSFASVVAAPTTLTPEQQAAAAQAAAAKKQLAALAEQAKQEQALARKVVGWATKWVSENADTLPNGGPTYKDSPVSRAVWAIVETAWAAKSDGTYAYSTRGPQVKGEKHLYAGENVGNLERTYKSSGFRGVDLHVLVTL